MAPTRVHPDKPPYYSPKKQLAFPSSIRRPLNLQHPSKDLTFPELIMTTMPLHRDDKPNLVGKSIPGLTKLDPESLKHVWPLSQAMHERACALLCLTHHLDIEGWVFYMRQQAKNIEELYIDVWTQWPVSLCLLLTRRKRALNLLKGLKESHDTLDSSVTVTPATYLQLRDLLNLIGFCFHCRRLPTHRSLDAFANIRSRNAFRSKLTRICGVLSLRSRRRTYFAPTCRAKSDRLSARVRFLSRASRARSTDLCCLGLKSCTARETWVR